MPGSRESGPYAPEQILNNRDLEKVLDTSDERIAQRTGIRQRHVAEEGEVTSDLAVRAARQALERAGMEPEDVDLIPVATTSPDMPFPSSGAGRRVTLATEFLDAPAGREADR